jgi:peptide chain release factor 3
MVIDAAKGIEPQTRKLFEVCRLRNVPIITFVNKVDREGRDPFALLDEVADALALDVCPMSWPVGMGGTFEGIFDFATGKLRQPSGPSREFEGTAANFRASTTPGWRRCCPQTVWRSCARRGSWRRRAMSRIRS